MNSLAGQTRTAALLIGCGLLGAGLTGCGAPRVHEVYRLSTLEAPQVTPRENLNAMQQDLRRMALQAQTLQPRLRAAAPSSFEALAALAPGNAHECSPGLLAHYDGAAFGPVAQLNWLATRPSTLGFSQDGEL